MRPGRHAGGPIGSGSRTGVMEPSGRGGVASTMVLQPARPAGVHSMSALEGRTAVPPGTYTPTAPAVGTLSLEQAGTN